jgi:hypothetical protein
LALHIFENPDHLVHFEEATLISTVDSLSAYLMKMVVADRQNILQSKEYLSNPIGELSFIYFWLLFYSVSFLVL